MAELRRWLADTPPEQSARSEIQLRVFFLDLLPPQQRLAFLDQQAERAAAHHAALRQILDSEDWNEAGMLTANGRLALEFGLRFTAMREDWARWAAKQIAAD